MRSEGWNRVIPSAPSAPGARSPRSHEARRGVEAPRALLRGARAPSPQLAALNRENDTATFGGAII